MAAAGIVTNVPKRGWQRWDGAPLNTIGAESAGGHQLFDGTCQSPSLDCRLGRGVNTSTVEERFGGSFRNSGGNQLALSPPADAMTGVLAELR